MKETGVKTTKPEVGHLPRSDKAASFKNLSVWFADFIKMSLLKIFLVSAANRPFLTPS